MKKACVKHKDVVSIFGESLVDFYDCLLEDLGSYDNYAGYFDSCNLPCPEYSPQYPLMDFPQFLYNMYGNSVSRGKDDYEEWLEYLKISMKRDE